MGSSVSFQERGRFSGRWPKGYQRSDDRIREDVCERLTRDPDIDASEIDVKVTNGEVTLTGTVDERQSKRMAEELAENISGVKDVHNQVRVKNRDTHSESGTNKDTKEMTGSKTR
jgi:osmotically-inducible protein OsmY